MNGIRCLEIRCLTTVKVVDSLEVAHPCGDAEDHTYGENRTEKVRVRGDPSNWVFSDIPADDPPTQQSHLESARQNGPEESAAYRLMTSMYAEYNRAKIPVSYKAPVATDICRVPRFGSSTTASIPSWATRTGGDDQSISSKRQDFATDLHRITRERGQRSSALLRPSR